MSNEASLNVTDADIKAALEPYADQLVPNCQDQLVRLFGDLKEVSPAILADTVKARLTSDDYAHFRRPAAQPVSNLGRLSAAFVGRNGGPNGLLSPAEHSKYIASQPNTPPAPPPAPPKGLAEYEQRYFEQQAKLRGKAIGLTGQFSPSKPTAK